MSFSKSFIDKVFSSSLGYESKIDKEEHSSEDFKKLTVQVDGKNYKVYRRVNPNGITSYKDYLKFLEKSGYEFEKPVNLPSGYGADVCVMNVGTYQRILFLIPFGTVLYTIEVDKDLTKEMYAFQDDTFFYKMSEVKEFVSELQRELESLKNPEAFPFNEFIVYSCY